MHIISVQVREKVAVNTMQTYYVCGNSDYIVRFDFDAEWDGLDTKTARFIKDDGSYTDVIFEGTDCPVPVIENTFKLLVGAYAGDLFTTTSAFVPARKSVLCGTGAPPDPTPDVYNQLMNLLNSIAENQVSPEQVQDAVNAYFAENPIDASGAVRFDTAQSLSEEQKEQARLNIGITPYKGEYSVTPSTEDDVMLQTAQKVMDANVRVKKIPYYDVSNLYGGSTVHIG